MRERDEGNVRFPPQNGSFMTGVRAGLTAIDVPAVPPVVWRREKWELCRDAVCGDIEAVVQDSPIAGAVRHAGPGRAFEKVDAVAGTVIDVELAADYPDGDVSDVVVRPPAVGPAGRIITQCRAQPILAFWGCWGDAEVKSQELGAGGATIGLV